MFTSEHDAFILMAHYRNGSEDADGNWTYSLHSCMVQFTQHFPNMDVDYEAFKQRRRVVIQRFEKRHCICTKKSSGRPTKLTEPVLDDIQERMERSPPKSISKLANQTGMSFFM